MGDTVPAKPSDVWFQGMCESPAAEAPLTTSLVGNELAAKLEGGAPDFANVVQELSTVQAAIRKVQELASAGRRQAFMGIAKLHRGDLAGARFAFEAAESQPSPCVEVCSDIWKNRELRLRICDAANFGSFAQVLIAGRCFLSFLERGVLTAGMPGCLRIDIESVDDERYLLGLIEGAREMERFSVNRGRCLDLQSNRICLRAVQSLEQALQQFDFRNSDLRRKFDGVKYAVKKLESLVYEVDLAKKRAAAGQDESGNLEEPPSKRKRSKIEQPNKVDISKEPIQARAIDLQLLHGIKERYDNFDGLRELTIKRSRDVLKNAKNAIFAMQRNDFKKAGIMLASCCKDANNIFDETLAQAPSLRGGLFSQSLEEYVEALVYRAFRNEKRLLNQSEVQAASGLSFPLTVVEYLGGIMDFTGEVARVAVRSASRGRDAEDEIQLCLFAADAIYARMQDLPHIPGGVAKKMGPLRGTLTKIEGVLYELSLLSRGGLSVRAPVPDNADKECVDDDPVL